MIEILKIIFIKISNPYIIICLFIGIIYIYLTATFQYWKILGVPFKKPTIIVGNFGNLLFFRKSQCEGIYEMYNSFKNSRYFGVFRIRTPILIIRDPNLIKIICIKDFNYFINRGIPINNHEILSRHLFNCEGEKWKNLRLKLNPIFSSVKIKKMFHLLIECHIIFDQLINCNNILNNNIIDVRELAGKFTIDIIGSCAFGIQINTLIDKNSLFHKYVKKISYPSYKSTLWRMLRISLPKIYNLFRIQLIDSEVTNFFLNIVSQMVKQREHEHENKRNDFMDLLIQLKNTKNTINKEENDNTFDKTKKKLFEDLDFDESMIAAQVFAFFAASYEAISNTIAFCLYELALNLEIQKNTQYDIWNAIKKNDGVLTYESLQEMTYLETVLLETMRKYPPAPITSRRCESPYKIPNSDIILPAGMRVVIPIYGIHHDAKYYVDPDKFIPNRFTAENKIIRHPYTYLPFGVGPRNCIGIKFAMIQMKLGIISFLKHNTVTISDKTTVPIKLSRRSVVTSSENGIWLKINRTEIQFQCKTEKKNNNE